MKLRKRTDEEIKKLKTLNRKVNKARKAYLAYKKEYDEHVRAIFQEESND